MSGNPLHGVPQRVAKRSGRNAGTVGDGDGDGDGNGDGDGDGTGVEGTSATCS